MSSTQIRDFQYRQVLSLLIIAALIFRWFIVLKSPLGLHGDEAQYWAWSQNLDWGYFSKPPLIAWVIALPTSLFGSAEWAVRLPSAFIHSLTTYVIYLTAKQAFDARSGFWAACTYLAMPAVWLSSTIISTDVPLLLCWALALNAWVALRESPKWTRTLQLGLAIGFGLLAKYAMLFFIPILVASIIFDASTRRALFGKRGLVVALISIAIFLPNIIWNLNHDFATVSHTAENANLSGPLINPGELLSFWIDQLGVFGPLSFPLLIITLFNFRKLTRFAKWLCVFALLPLFVISAEALLSRANANWAVTAYIAAPIIVAVFVISRAKLLQLLKWGLIGQSFIMVSLGLILLSSNLTDLFGLSNSVKRLRAWPETISQIEALYKEGHGNSAFEAIAVDNRLVFYDATYYRLADKAPLSMWTLSNSPGNHAEMTSPLKAMKGPVLLINHYQNYEPFFREDFSTLIELEPLSIDLGGGKQRDLKVWVGYDYAPVDRARAL